MVRCFSYSYKQVTVGAPCLAFGVGVGGGGGGGGGGGERKKAGGWGGDYRGESGVCASVSQTCSSNGLYYLLLFAVCCNQAPE